MVKKMKKAKAIKAKPEKSAGKRAKKKATGKKDVLPQAALYDAQLIKTLRKRVKRLEAKVQKLDSHLNKLVEGAAGVAQDPRPTQSVAGEAAAGGPPDDLQKLRGIGPALAARLNTAGIFCFKQLAEMSDEQLQLLDDELLTKGRPVRDDWRGQADRMVKSVACDTA